MKNYVCIDVGGTSIKYGVISEKLDFVVIAEMDTEASKGGQNILSKMVEIVSNYKDNYKIDGICISAALAEHFAGGAKGSKISLCLTIGTGIGGAIIINNEVYHGAFGSGGEVGYMNMMGSTFQKLGASSVLVKKVAEMKNIDEKDINGKYIFDKAKDGDPDCIKAIEELTEVLGEGIANICYIINPEVVVLGGGIMAQREYLYDKIRSSMDKNLIPFIGDKTRLEFAVNENKAGMLGAYFNFINMQKKR